MQAKIISRIRTNTTEEHATDPEQTGTEQKIIFRIRLDDMPQLPSTRYMRASAPGWVPNYAQVTETLISGYGEEGFSHHREVHASGFLVRKDGTVGKLATDDTWRTYSSTLVPGSLASMPTPLHEALAQVVPAFQKGILP